MSWKHIQRAKLIQEAGGQRIESGQGGFGDSMSLGTFALLATIIIQ